jgi:hypothetical protein
MNDNAALTRRLADQLTIQDLMAHWRPEVRGGRTVISNAFHWEWLAGTGLLRGIAKPIKMAGQSVLLGYDSAGSIEAPITRANSFAEAKISAFFLEMAIRRRFGEIIRAQHYCSALRQAQGSQQGHHLLAA